MIKMSEKRFACKVKKQGDIEYVLFIDTSEEVEYMSFFEIIDLVNKLNDDNEKLRKKINTYESEPFEDGLNDETKISIFNKDKGDWKWNDNNDTIINIRTGEKFYLRNSGAVENLVELLNEQQATIQRMKHSLNTIYKAFEKHYGYDM